MSPFLASAKSEFWTGTVRKTKKILRWFLILLVIFCGIFIYVKFFYTYSEGSRVGLLQKFSKKGMLFKTYEGEMILSSISSNRNVALASEKFLFSVTGKGMAQKFDSLQGRNVVVYYNEKRGVVFWRGDSKYIVDSIALRE